MEPRPLFETVGNVDYSNAASISEAISDCDVVIDANNFKGDDASTFKDNILVALKQVAADHQVLYFPSEYGVDWREHTFAQAVWDSKKAHQEQARDVPHLKVVAIYCSLIMERAFGAWFGYDLATYTIRPIGSSQSRVSYTSLADLGRSVATLSTYAALNGIDALPDHIRLAGETLTYEEVGSVMSAADPLRQEVKQEPHEKTPEAVSSLLASGGQLSSWGGPADWIRVLGGQGNLDMTNNELYTIGEETVRTTGRGFIEQIAQEPWQWRAAADYAEEVKGRPWM